MPWLSSRRAIPRQEEPSPESQTKSRPARLSGKPNLLVILPDQQRADTLACYGGRPSYAPNLNKLASESVVFDQAYVTQSICTPSRSSLQTGTWPHANGCTRNNISLEPRFLCLPELLNDSDYRTGYMGKWHLGDELMAQRGFEEWVSIIDYKANFRGGGRQRVVSDYSKFLRSKGYEPDDKKKGIYTLRFAAKLPLEFSRAKFLETKVCDFLERHRQDPFLLFVSLFEPHPPYNGPLNDAHPLDQIEREPSADHIFGPDMPLRYRLRQEFYLSKSKVGASPDEYLKIKQRYLGLVTQVDRSIGAILAKLEALGLADSTIVIQTSDHGDMMGAHRLFGKEVLFQEASRVPWLVRLPNQRRPFSISQPVSHIDFVPTVLDLLEKEIHPQCAGKSLAPLLRGESMPPETIFLERAPARRAKVVPGTTLASESEIQSAIHESTRAAVSPDGWKICLRDKDKNELYHLRRDPSERENLYASAPKDVVARLTGEIHRWQEKVGDTLKV
jgi:arylsulfatase A-like enzyme